MNKKIMLYLLPATIAFFIYRILNGNIEIMLKPHVFTIQLLYPMRFEFIPNLGYQEVHGLFTIGASCSGAKLFVCLFSILIICCINHESGLKYNIYKVVGFCILSLFLSYAITVMRIAASIPFCNMSGFKLIHTLLSLAIYFGSGLALYAVVNYQLKRKGELKNEYR